MEVKLSTHCTIFGSHDLMCCVLEIYYHLSELKVCQFCAELKLRPSKEMGWKGREEGDTHYRESL